MFCKRLKKYRLGIFLVLLLFCFYCKPAYSQETVSSILEENENLWIELFSLNPTISLKLTNQQSMLENSNKTLENSSEITKNSKQITFNLELATRKLQQISIEQENLQKEYTKMKLELEQKQKKKNKIITFSLVGFSLVMFISGFFIGGKICD